MKKSLGLFVALSFAPLAHAADIEAGKAKVAVVCAACHGANGVSVSDTIPNLAAQRSGYLEAQLRALKDGTRKNPIMNAIAAQLSPDEMANVAAYFASLPGAGTAMKSVMLPNVAKTHVTFPEGYKDTFKKYHTINFPATKQVRYYFANPDAIQAAKAGKPIPDGAVLFTEVYAAKTGADGKPVTGPDGFFVAEKLLFYTAMATGADWGSQVPEMLRNGNWNYAVFTLDKQHRPGVNQAECYACHKPLDKESYVFTLKQLADVK